MLTKYIAPTLFSFWIAVPGVFGFASTKLPNTDLSVVSGTYQNAYEDRFSDSFLFKQIAGDAFTAFNLALFGQADAGVVIGKHAWLFTAEEFSAPIEYVNLTEALNQTKTRLARDGITLIPVIVPDKARIYSDKLPRPRGSLLETRYATALKVLKDQDLDSINLVERLRNGRISEETFLRTDTHWSPHGAALVAQSLAEGAGLLGAGTVQFETNVASSEPFEGDLYKFVDTGRFSDWVVIAPETFARPVTTAEQAPEADLFGDAEIGIVLVGTSFSAREEFNFSGALRAATNMDVLNLAVEGQGPFVPMQDVLDSGIIEEISPQYVVWEIPERYIQPWSVQ